MVEVIVGGGGLVMFVIVVFEVECFVYYVWMEIECGFDFGEDFGIRNFIGVVGVDVYG